MLDEEFDADASTVDEVAVSPCDIDRDALDPLDGPLPSSVDAEESSLLSERLVAVLAAVEVAVPDVPCVPCVEGAEEPVDPSGMEVDMLRLMTLAVAVVVDRPGPDDEDPPLSLSEVERSPPRPPRLERSSRLAVDEVPEGNSASTDASRLPTLLASEQAVNATKPSSNIISI